MLRSPTWRSVKDRMVKKPLGEREKDGKSVMTTRDRWEDRDGRLKRAPEIF